MNNQQMSDMKPIVPVKGKRVVLAGGSGYLGQLLAKELVERGAQVIVLTRKPSSRQGPIQEAFWDGRTLGEWAQHLDGARGVVNLAGRSVNCRYTAENRREIVESRVDSVKVIGEAIRQCTVPPKVWVQAGSLAIYGDPGDKWCDENAPAGEGFPAEVCLAWEKAYNESAMLKSRRVLLRISFVLGAGGGALKVLANLTKSGLGGTVGNGKQYISWLHERDMNGIFLAAIEREDMEGVFNATGPEPVTNAEFMRELRRVLHRPWSPPAPVWAVKIGARLMGTEASLALTGRRCAPKRLLDCGFKFQFPELHGALADIYERRADGD